MCIQTNERTLGNSHYHEVAFSLFGLQLAIYVAGLFGGRNIFFLSLEIQLIGKALVLFFTCKSDFRLDTQHLQKAKIKQQNHNIWLVFHK